MAREESRKGGEQGGGSSSACACKDCRRASLPLRVDSFLLRPTTQCVSRHKNVRVGLALMRSASHLSLTCPKTEGQRSEAGGWCRDAFSILDPLEVRQLEIPFDLEPLHSPCLLLPPLFPCLPSFAHSLHLLSYPSRSPSNSPSISCLPPSLPPLSLRSSLLPFSPWSLPLVWFHLPSAMSPTPSSLQRARNWAIAAGWMDSSHPNGVVAGSLGRELLEELRVAAKAQVDCMRDSGHLKLRRSCASSPPRSDSDAPVRVNPGRLLRRCGPRDGR